MRPQTAATSTYPYSCRRPRARAAPARRPPEHLSRRPPRRADRRDGAALGSVARAFARPPRPAERRAVAGKLARARARSRGSRHTTCFGCLGAGAADARRAPRRALADARAALADASGRGHRRPRSFDRGRALGNSTAAFSRAPGLPGESVALESPDAGLAARVRRAVSATRRRIGRRRPPRVALLLASPPRVPPLGAALACSAVARPRSMSWSPRAKHRTRPLLTPRRAVRGDGL